MLSAVVKKIVNVDNVGRLGGHAVSCPVLPCRFRLVESKVESPRALSLIFKLIGILSL